MGADLGQEEASDQTNYRRSDKDDQGSTVTHGNRHGTGNSADHQIQQHGNTAGKGGTGSDDGGIKGLSVFNQILSHGRRTHIETNIADDVGDQNDHVAAGQQGDERTDNINKQPLH